ncbi:MAG: RNA polymerase sigma factor [Desertimonas sp.]
MVRFEAVVGLHFAVVWSLCRALLSEAYADDAWSETFLAAMRAYPELPPNSHVKGWLVTIAHRKAIDVHRARARRPVPVAELPEHVAADPPAAPLDDDMATAVAALAPKQRAAVVHHHLAGMPYAEVAEAMGVSVTAARRNAADGIAALRRTLTSRIDAAER